MATRRMVALLLCLATTLCVVRTQQTEKIIDSLSVVHNFGTIAGKRGTVSHSFTLRDVSDQPMVILRVDMDCGCATPTYDHTAVIPDDSVPIQITCNPLDHPDSFIKYTRVCTSIDPNRPIKLTVKGNVATLGRQTPTNALYQQEVEALQVGDLFLDFPSQPAGGEDTIHLMPSNPAGRPLEVSLDIVPSFLSTSISRTTLAAYEPKEIFLKAHDDGSIAPGIHKGWIDITIHTQDDESDLSGGVTVRLVIPPSSVGGTPTPRAGLKTYQRLIDLTPEDQVYKGTVALKNDGEAPMQLCLVKGNTIFLTILDYPKTIAPGANADIRYRLKLEGVDHPRRALKANFDLLLNDPNAPLRNVLIVVSKR